ncbi:MAG: aminotransferase class I/II-fold pyridoxal phosphate-dependent enzyme [Desulfobacterales bacterium]|nr:aminotransferase class I/II-fold pyridoxal phosphate-dependent enzyme [Desulfobacterales bacterium]
MKGFSTKAVHGRKLKPDVHGALRFPVYDSVAFEYENARDIQLAFEGKKPAHSYTRITNPTVEDFEQRINLIADSLAVVAVSSGMAAISNLILTIAETGANIVTTKFLFGNTYSLFERTFKPWGLQVKYVNFNDMDMLQNAIDEKTRAVFLEIITNPQLQVPDIGKIAEIARKKNVPLVVDGTVTTPYIFKSADFGVSVEVLSSTKYISGGATTVGGLIIDNGNFDWKNNPNLKDAVKYFGNFSLVMTLKREVFRNIGACLSPHNAYLQALGLETLDLRIDKSCANALQVSEYLAGCKKVRSVNYPGLKASRYHEIARKQFKDKFGGILTFELADKKACFAFMDNLRLIKRATNINDNKTLILHPWSTIYCEFSPEEKGQMGVSESMLRLSVGIEDVEDIVEDIDNSLEGV